ncbi:hypothetical protein [Sorangium sp. So ce385]|uniref:hypothetical protein n=1 Tax=Sorangium sp. So ce385 TaxID=3133308 RepID=UPI003F5BA3C2
MDRRQQLSIYHDACEGDCRKVARYHIFRNRETITPEDHEYLAKHINALTWDEYASWLAHDPANPRLLVERIIASFPIPEPGEEPVTFLLRNPLAWSAGRYPPGVLDELVDRLRPPRLAERSWWDLARQLQDVCSPYAAILKANAPPLALALFDKRRDERGFASALATALRSCGGLERADLLELAHVAGLLERVRPDEVLPETLHFEHEPEATEADRQFRSMALQWPGDEGAVARAWFLAQVVAAAARGVQPLVLWRATPPELREAVAFQAQDAGQVLPWLITSLREALERREPDAWDRLFRYLDMPGARTPFKRVWSYRDAPAPSGPKVEELDLLDPTRQAVSLLLNAPLPENVDDCFEERLLSYRELMTESSYCGPMTSVALFHRIASFPLTTARANRLLRWALQQHAAFASSDELIRISIAADPLPESELPSVDQIVANSADVEGVALYARIAGPLAEERLRAWLRSPLDRPGEDLEHAFPEWQPFGKVLARARLLPDLVEPDVRQWLTAEARKLPTRRMVGLLRPANMSWLLDEATVAASALARAHSEQEPWVACWDTPAEFPDALLPAVRERVRSPAVGDEELVELLRWLETHNEPMRSLVSAMLDHLRDHKPGRAALRWLASTLRTRTRWAHHGRDVLLALLDAEAWEELLKLARDVVPSPEATADPEGRERHRMVVALHDAFARALVKVAERALEHDATSEVLGALHGLAALHPLTSVRKLLHHLRQKPGVTEPIAEMIALNEELLRRDTTHEGREHDLAVALSLLLEKRASPAPAVVRPTEARS